MIQPPFVSPILLSGLNSMWGGMVDSGISRTWQPKAVIAAYPSGSAKGGIYFIRKGVVRLSHLFASGEERILLFFGAGTIFNETPIFARETTCVFTSMERTDTVFWSELQVKTFIRKEPDLALNLLASLGVKVQSFYSQLCDVRTYSTFENVCRLLYSIAVHQREQDRVVPHLTQLDLASLLGIHRSSLHKALSRLQDEGVIGEYSKKKLQVYDMDTLLKFASLHE